MSKLLHGAKWWWKSEKVHVYQSTYEYWSLNTGRFRDIAEIYGMFGDTPKPFPEHVSIVKGHLLSNLFETRSYYSSMHILRRTRAFALYGDQTSIALVNSAYDGITKCKSHVHPSRPYSPRHRESQSVTIFVEVWLCRCTDPKGSRAHIKSGMNERKSIHGVESKDQRYKSICKATRLVEEQPAALADQKALQMFVMHAQMRSDSIGGVTTY